MSTFFSWRFPLLFWWTLSGHHSLFSFHRQMVHWFPLRSRGSSATKTLVLSIHRFTVQSWANASLSHSTHANTFTPFMQIVATKGGPPTLREKSSCKKRGGYVFLWITSSRYFSTYIYIYIVSQKIAIAIANFSNRKFKNAILSAEISEKRSQNEVTNRCVSKSQIPNRNVFTCVTAKTSQRCPNFPDPPTLAFSRKKKRARETPKKARVFLFAKPL